MSWYDNWVHQMRLENPWARYSEMGSRDKKTGKLKHYTVTRHLIKNTFTCECPSGTYRPYQECKHVKRLKEKLLIK